MADPIDIRPLIGLPPADTARAFDARGDLRVTAKWHEMYGGEHSRAFTVAHLARLDLLDDIRNSLADVLNNGGTFAQWQANIIPTLQRAGWWGRVEDKALTGTSAPIFVGPRRLETIFRTNLRVSRAAGQWQRIQDRKDAAPYLMYVSVRDTVTRPLHRLWGGNEPGRPLRIILPVDHPCWAIYYPPNGWNCRCIVVQLTARDLEAMGLRVTTNEELVRVGWMTAAGEPGGGARSFWRAGSDRPEQVPAGVDAGWNYNPGQTAMRAIADKAAATLGRYAESDLEGARFALRELLDAPGLLQALDEPGAGVPVMILDDAVRAAIGAQGRVGILSSETFAKQRVRHPDIGIADYRRLPDIGAAPDLVFQQDDQRLIFMRSADGRWMKAVVKVTADRGEIFVTSLEWARAREIQRVQRRLPLVFGQFLGALAAIIAAQAAEEEELPADADGEAVA